MFDIKAEPEKVKIGGKKTVAARKKAAKASNAQPPKGRSKAPGNTDNDEIDISKLSEKAFDKLTLKERKVLRGD